MNGIKILEPTITCLMMSHMKYPYFEEAVESVLAQTRVDYELIIVDSGAWIGKPGQQETDMNICYLKYKEHPRITWITTGELPDMHKSICMVAHWTNIAYKQRLLRGKYFCTFYDDDYYYPEFFEKMAGYMDANPDCMAVRCTQARAKIHENGLKEYTPSLEAKEDISGQNFDCRVDGGQVMLRTEVLDKIPYPLLDENMEHCSHSDGVFLNKVGAVIDKMHFINETLYEHRHTPISTFTPTHKV